MNQADNTDGCPLCDGTGNIATAKTEEERCIVGIEAERLFLDHGMQLNFKDPLVRLSLIDAADAREAGATHPNGKVDPEVSAKLKIASRSYQLNFGAVIALRMMTNKICEYIDLDKAVEDMQDHRGGETPNS